MTALVLHLTNAGLAAVEAVAGTSTVTIAELGLSDTPFTVAPTLTALPGEFKRLDALSGTEAAPNITHMTAYDTSADTWSATGIALYLSDGTLFAVYSSDDIAISKAAPAFALISFDIAFDANLSASIIFGDPVFTNPPATTEVRGLVELATGPETFDGLDVTRAVTPAGLAAALVDMIKAHDGTGSGIDADLLDGHDSGYFLPAADFTGTNIRTLLETVDGTTSGLDADLLDGHDSSYFLAASLLPAGIITMWSGSVASVPAGWHLCDGTSGTPDLRDRFVIGAGSTYAVNATGGAATHNHAVTVDGHTLTTAEIPAHHHDMFVAGSVSDIGAVGAGQTVARATNSDPGESEYIMRPLAGTPSTGITGDAGGGSAHDHTASSANASSLPPYLALAYIMKL